ncbi:hypothetical protein A2U01_0030865, partial [Trifolium medium]|nr:hypothetical protein [Trifolium medium]
GKVELKELWLMSSVLSPMSWKIPVWKVPLKSFPLMFKWIKVVK